MEAQMANKTVPDRKDSGPPPPQGFWEQLKAIATSSDAEFRRYVILWILFLAGVLALVIGTAFSVTMLAGHLAASSGIAASGVAMWLVAGTRKVWRKFLKRDRGDGTSA
jgi:hypothetical protein